MAGLFQMLSLACADYRHEKLLSLCSVLGLAAVLTPLLILYGVKFGVVETMTERMKNDPRMLEVSPVSSGRFEARTLKELAREKGVAFVLPRTRSISATMKLSTLPGDDGRRRSCIVSLEPTAAGDPLLARYGCEVPCLHLEKRDPAQAQPRGGLGVNLESLQLSGAVLTQEAGEKLGCAKGDMLVGSFERAFEGKISTARVKIRVAGILPLAAQQKDGAYIPLALLEASEDFRDGRGVPALGEENGWSGEPVPEGERVYPGFRLYAATLDDVPLLRARFAERNVATYTHAEEIAQIKALERGLNVIFSLVCAAAGLGFFFSTASSVFAGIKRKERTLGLLQLAGFSTGAIMLFPLVQVVLTALLGTGLASLVYLAIAHVINSLFQGSLQGLEQVCRLLPCHYGLALGASAGLSLLAALGPAWHSTKIEPSEVIRDV